MVKESTINNTIEILKLVKDSGLSINGYFKSVGKQPNNFYTRLRKIESCGQVTEELRSLLNAVKYRDEVLSTLDEPEQLELFSEEEIQDTEDRIESSVLRNNEGKIVGYKFKVFRRDNTPVEGILNRDEMQLIYRLYSYYGAGITQREISRHFPDYSLIDFKRILKAFNITKASGPFAPHMYEEKDEEELKEIHLREKENDFLKKIEKDELKDVQNTAVKLARRNRELEQTIEQLSQTINIEVNSSMNVPTPEKVESDKSIIIHLADMHIGAKCNSNCIYPNPYDKEEIERRLNALLVEISAMGFFDTIIINILGDSLDGMDQQTARRDHIMPQCMDNMEQLETFINLTFNFINACTKLANNLRVFCVKCGNHGGMWEYTANLALKNAVEKALPKVEFTLFKEFVGVYEVFGHIYLICHGKDEAFMKKPLPVSLDDKSRVFIQEILTDRGVIGYENVHFIKGDLHSNSLSSCKLFDYRNVLSLFGASDYSAYNFSRNAYGVSYDLFIGNHRTIGTFENL